MDLLSIVIPVYNEEQLLPHLAASLLRILRKTDLASEIILVNDGSRDASLEVMVGLAASHPEIKIVDLSRNFGKEYAVSAGLRFARGEAVVVMDGDLQHPPEVISRLIEKWREGHDVVYARHVARREESRMKKMLSALFYLFFNRLTETPIPQNVGDFLLLDRRVVDSINTLPERNRFMKGLFAWVGFRRSEVEYEQAERALGSSKWSLWKLWNFALDGLTSFTTLPLRLWSYIGLLVSLLAMLYALYLVLRTLILGVDVPGFASLIVVMLMLGGIQLISLGVIGEYLGRLYHEVKQRPLFLVRRTYGFTEADEGQADPPSSGLGAKHPGAGEQIGEERHQ